MTNEPQKYEEEISLFDLLLTLAESARLIAVGALLLGVTALGIAFLIPPTFTATTRLLPPQQQQGMAAMVASQLGALSGLAGAAGVNIKNPADMYIALLKSRTVGDRIIDRFNLMGIYNVKYRDDARDILSGRLRASTGKDGLIALEIDDRDPARAAELANAYVEELSRLTGSLAITEAQQRRLFFEKQLQQAQENLKKAEAALAEVGAGENLLKSAPQAVVEGIARLKAQLTSQEIRIATMRSYLTETSPELQLAQRELASLRTQLAQTERNKPTSGNGTDYLNRFRDFKYQETLFELMAKQYEVARLDEAREGAVIQVVDKALPPERKSRPRRGLIAVAATLLSAVAMATFVLLRDSVRRAQQDPNLASRLSRIGNTFRVKSRRAP
jgi:tyrosine-protein kinase Etk/Wzc